MKKFILLIILSLSLWCSQGVTEVETILKDFKSNTLIASTKYSESLLVVGFVKRVGFERTFKETKLAVVEFENVDGGLDNLSVIDPLYPFVFIIQTGDVVAIPVLRCSPQIIAGVECLASDNWDTWVSQFSVVPSNVLDMAAKDPQLTIDSPKAQKLIEKEVQRRFEELEKLNLVPQEKGK